MLGIAYLTLLEPNAKEKEKGVQTEQVADMFRSRVPALRIVAVVTATGFSPPSGALIGRIADAIKSDDPLPPDIGAQSLLAVAQTPEIAQTISGMVYRFSDNPLGSPR